MDPVEMKVQVLTRQGAAYANAWEDYGEALDEWSGGKIKFRMHYYYAIVPRTSPRHSDDLIDAAAFQPSFEPDEFPGASFIGKRSVTGPNTPIAGAPGQLSTWSDMGYAEAIAGELEDYGIHPLIPIVMAGGPFQRICGDEPVNIVDSLDGVVVLANPPPRGVDGPVLPDLGDGHGIGQLGRHDGAVHAVMEALSEAPDVSAGRASTSTVPSDHRMIIE